MNEKNRFDPFTMVKTGKTIKGGNYEQNGLKLIGYQ